MYSALSGTVEYETSGAVCDVSSDGEHAPVCKAYSIRPFAGLEVEQGNAIDRLLHLHEGHLSSVFGLAPSSRDEAAFPHLSVLFRLGKTRLVFMLRCRERLLWSSIRSKVFGLWSWYTTPVSQVLVLVGGSGSYR